VTIKLITLLLFVIVLSLVFVTAEGRSKAVTSLASTGRQKSAGENTSAHVYKNIQVLKDLPASELDGVMNFMCAALGVGCTYCHINPWESDQKPAKIAARRMIQMTRSINLEHFSGNPAITCYTCHRGQHNSVPNPPIDIALTNTSDDESGTVKLTLPATDEIIDKYVRAVGGPSAIASMKTLVSKGSEQTSNRMTPPKTSSIEIVQAAPDKFLIARRSASGITTEGFDGLKGWNRDERGAREIKDSELNRTKKDADSLRYLKIKDTYPQMRVLGKENIDAREVFVVGATSREGDRDKLYFDVASGLLVRKSSAFRTAFGSIPEVMDFSDYRDVNGVKLPLTIKWSRPPFGYVRKFSEIKLNTLIDPLRFRVDAK